jgi:opacity protein-like surface antigen
MRLLATTAIVLVLGTAGALAADPPELIIDDEAIDMATKWDGVYIGAGVRGLVDVGFNNGLVDALLYVGANATFDGFLIGAEGYFGPEFTGGGFASWVSGGEVRAGGLVTDDILIYGALGVETLDFGDFWYGTAGAGVEVGLSESVSLDLEYQFVFGLDNAFLGHAVSASLLWHL